jgi:hypothetical protein
MATVLLATGTLGMAVDVDTMPQVPHETPGQDPEGGSECDFATSPKASDDSDDAGMIAAEMAAVSGRRTGATHGSWQLAFFAAPHTGTTHPGPGPDTGRWR